MSASAQTPARSSDAAGLPAPEAGTGAGGGHGRLVAVFGLCSLASGTALRSLDPLLLEVSRDFAASPDRVALLASAYALPYALIQPVLGPVGDALGKRRVMLFCTAVLAAALLACAFAPGLGTLFAARVAAGLAAGGIIPLALAGLGDAVPMAGRQVAISRLLLFSISGQIGGGIFAGLVSGALGWRGVSVACAAVALLGAAVLAADNRRSPDPPPERLDVGRAGRRYGAILRNPAARVLFVGVALEGMLVFGLFPFLAAILRDRGLGGAAEAGLVLGCFGVGGLVFAGTAPLLLRRLGQENLLRVGGAATLAGFAAVSVAGSVPVMAAAALVVGTGFLMMHNSIQTRVTEVAPNARASAVALHAFCFFLGQASAPVMFGAVWGAAGLTGALLFCGLGLTLLGLWLAPRR